MSNLLKDNKELMKQWDYEKNKDFDLNKITIGNKNKAWWICSKGHSYEQVIHSKSKGVGCPVCSNKLVLKGFNDLATTNPELLNEWYYEKNTANNITPYNITKGAEKKVWWICPKCHSYDCTISHRTIDGNNCPYCSSERLLKGYNDLATTNPEVLALWNYKRNNSLKIYPDEVFKGSHRKVWWICSKGHEWYQKIYIGGAL